MLILAGAGILMSACTFTQHTVSNNPVGTKKGEKKQWLTSSNISLGYKDVAGDGTIRKIGTTEYRVMYFLGAGRVTHIVTGE